MVGGGWWRLVVASYEPHRILDDADDRTFLGVIFSVTVVAWILGYTAPPERVVSAPDFAAIVILVGANAISVGARLCSSIRTRPSSVRARDLRSLVNTNGEARAMRFSIYVAM